MSKSASRIPSNSSGNSFGQLWLARDVAALGDWVAFITLLCYSAIFTDSASTLGLLIAIMLAPRFILGPLVSRVVTWRNATAFAIAAQVARAAVLAPAFFLQREDGTQAILIMAGAYAFAGPFLGAAQRVLFSSVVVGDEQRTKARTALLNTWLLTLAVGPAFGYAIYGAGGLRSGAAATVVALFVSAALLFMTRPRRAVEPAGAGADLLVGVSPLPVGIVEAFRDPDLQQVAAIQVIASILAGGVGVLEAAYTTNGLYLAIDNIGILLASQGFGIAIAGFGYMRMGKRYSTNTAVATGLALLGGGELGLAISSGLQAGMGFMAVIGAGIGLVLFSMWELSLEIASSPDRKLPAISVRTLVDGLILTSAAIAAPLCQSISPRFTLVLTGTLIWVLALYSFGAVPALVEQDEQGDAPTYPR